MSCSLGQEENAYERTAQKPLLNKENKDHYSLRNDRNHGKSVTHVPGQKCYLCARTFRRYKPGSIEPLTG